MTSQKFTVKQIYLLTELRNTGMSDDQIYAGLRQIDELKGISAELSFNQQPFEFPSNGFTSNSESIVNGNSSMTSLKAGIKRRRESIDSPHMTSSAFDTSTTNDVTETYPYASMVYGRQDPYAKYENGGIMTSSPGHSIPLQNLTKSISVAELDELDPEVRDLLKRDVQEVKKEIQEFMSEYKITQSYIVKATDNRLSQPYISTWLLNPRSRNFRKIRILYDWYVRERRQVNILVATTTGSSFNSLVSNNNSLLLRRNLATTQADAYWPLACENFLEEYFQTDPNPNDVIKKSIATNCTDMIQTQLRHQGVSTRVEPISPNQVNAWFMSRRHKVPAMTSSTARSESVASSSSSNHDDVISNNILLPQQLETEDKVKKEDDVTDV